VTRPVTLAVLAGGRGRRLGGRIKPLATKDGEALAARILRVLGGQVEARFLVAPPDLVSALSPLAEVVEDPGEGPGPAVMAAAEAAKTEWLLVVAGDHVAPSAALFDALWAARAEHDAVCVSAEGRAQGGFSLFRVSALLAQPPPEPFSLWRLFAALDTRFLPLEGLDEAASRSLEDVDTEEDARRWGLELPGRG